MEQYGHAFLPSGSKAVASTEREVGSANGPDRTGQQQRGSHGNSAVGPENPSWLIVFPAPAARVIVTNPDRLLVLEMTDSPPVGVSGKHGAIFVPCGIEENWI